MKLSKFANLVKNGGRCAVLHVAGSGIWLSTGTAIYRATELRTWRAASRCERCWT